MMYLLGFVSMMITLLLPGCKDGPVDPPPLPPQEKKWEVVQVLKDYDIRGFKEHNGKLYVTTNQRTDSGLFGLIYETEDGNIWSLFKTFNSFISPLSFHGDTMVLANIDSVWIFQATIGWKRIFKLPFIGADDIRDIFYLNNSLYIMAVRFWMFSDSGLAREIDYPQQGGKFLVHKVGNSEVAYYRPWAYASKFYKFNGEIFFEMTNGLTESEKNISTVDAMWLKNDTLFAGFFNPGSIKYYSGNKWNTYTDTLPYSKYAFQFNPTIKTRPTVICFVDESLYVGTDYIGILKWEKNKEWKLFSNGLPKLNQDFDVYMGMNFLQYFKGSLFTGYGEPSFSPYVGPTGVYKYIIK
jgi:hypothetical protein